MLLELQQEVVVFQIAFIKGVAYDSEIVLVSTNKTDVGVFKWLTIYI